ncbi:exodeoxyribonuclease VII large subunit [Alkalibacter mobilis]|uniref:exodeoxyribonuclease VII large subunit n=1 Tax=Alkalibacter mobilis TaxID=2787712 RepID=UPI00189F4684|nr:exodeoxyribonuclease VII large subunit [Alkalibacter mobilis]MBF7097111.1 exodeoxyribonuclease VII large subunit [Alkalibacter mobilis]
MKQKTISVGKLTKYIKSIFDNDVILRNVLVEGEISNFKLHSSGHAYFSLKDNEGRINCVMFKNVADTVGELKDGDNVILQGNVSVYEKNGQYQLYVKRCQIQGVGDLYAQFEKLKEELSDLGWFDEKNKKSLPKMPVMIGIVTSPTGAAIRDLISVITRRFKNIQIQIYPASVQGDKAPGEISKGIQVFNTMAEVDLIIIGRGGGSIEELWAFNERIVAGAIHDSKIPVISAVGHETDFTISDFVADLRAPTPSAAGEIAVPSLDEIMNRLSYFEDKLTKNIDNKLNVCSQKIKNLKSAYFFANPEMFFIQHAQTLDVLRNTIVNQMRSNLQYKLSKITEKKSRLEGLDPSNVLKRGFAAIRNEEGMYITDLNEIEINAQVDIVFVDGVAKSKIIGKEANYEKKHI